MRDYRGKTVWITGASSGIGEALAHAFAARGARLVLSARRAERLHEVARASGSRDVTVLPLDLSQVDALPALAAEAERRAGPIDVMVHNAGVGQRSTVIETQLHVVRRLMEVNYFAPVALTQALLPGMLTRGAGTFVVVSSVLGLYSSPRRAAYAASKHALHGFFDGLRAELAQNHSNVDVLLVCPGRVPSGFQQAALEGDGRPHGTREARFYQGVSPELCASRTLQALDRGASEVYVARWENVPRYLKRFSPSLLRLALARSKAT